MATVAAGVAVVVMLEEATIFPWDIDRYLRESRDVIKTEEEAGPNCVFSPAPYARLTAIAYAVHSFNSVNVRLLPPVNRTSLTSRAVYVNM